MINMDEQKNLISEAIIIAGVTLLGYLVGFVYEYGYAYYYGIPVQFITLSITHLLAAGAALVFVALFIYPIPNLIYMTFWNRGANRIILPLLIFARFSDASTISSHFASGNFLA